MAGGQGGQGGAAIPGRESARALPGPCWAAHVAGMAWPGAGGDGGGHTLRVWQARPVPGCWRCGRHSLRGELCPQPGSLCRERLRPCARSRPVTRRPATVRAGRTGLRGTAAGAAGALQCANCFCRSDLNTFLDYLHFRYYLRYYHCSSLKHNLAYALLVSFEVWPSHV
jgi:hypothetical protein